MYGTAIVMYGHTIYGSFVLLFLERILKLEQLGPIECSDSALTSLLGSACITPAHPPPHTHMHTHTCTGINGW